MGSVVLAQRRDDGSYRSSPQPGEPLHLRDVKEDAENNSCHLKQRPPHQRHIRNVPEEETPRQELPTAIKVRNFPFVGGDTAFVLKTCLICADSLWPPFAP